MVKALGPDDPREIAGYRVRGRLGTGGMGAVYLAHTRAGQPVALKVIRREFAENPEFRRRFAREVEAARRVHGLYTAPVVDSDTEGPDPWLASAYVPGPALGHAVHTHGPLPTRTAFQLVAGVAEALQSVHRAGVVHRDLKPSNVLLASDGPRVIDFGVARALDATALTATDVRVGTPGYMAPEQVSGTTTSPALDVFALGLLAHFAATGTHPFGEGSGEVLLYRIVAAEPDLTDCPPELAELVVRCLEKEPTARPEPGEVIEECRRLAGADALDRGLEGWLPETVAGQVARREADAPGRLPHPTDAPPGTAPPGTAPPGTAPPGTAPPGAFAPRAVVPPHHTGSLPGPGPVDRQPTSSRPLLPPPDAPLTGQPLTGQPPAGSPSAAFPLLGEPDPVAHRKRRRARLRVAGAVLTALAVIGVGTLAITQLTGGGGGGGGKGDGKGGATARYAQPLGNILVDGEPITGSQRSDRDDFAYQRTYSEGELYAAVTGYNSQAHGTAGLEAVYGNILGGVADRLEGGGPGSVVTTIDPAVQRAAFQALTGRTGDGDPEQGAAVAIDPGSGEVLAVVSTPSYDPGTFSGGAERDTAAWQKLERDQDDPLLNRALSQAQRAGTAFELVVAAAALEEGRYGSIDEPTQSPEPYAVPGGLKIDSGSPVCENANLRTALRYSCNNVFAKLAVDLGNDRLREVAEAFGFNAHKQRVPVPLATSVFPATKNRAEQALSGAGRFAVTATPFQMAVVTAVLANDGKRVAPHLVSRVTDADGKTLERHDGPGPKRVVSARTATQLRAAMETAAENGTGAIARLPGVDVGAKTGQARFERDGQHVQTGWFTSFGLTDGKRQVVVAVRLEAGNRSGADAATAAARIAQRTMRAALEGSG